MIANLSNSAVSRPLKVIASLFVILGIFSVIDIVVGIFLGRLVFNLGILCVLTGQGLLRLRPCWLTWAVLFTRVGLVSMPIAAAIFMFTPNGLQHLTIFGLNAGQAPHGLCFALSVAAFAFCCWQYRILKSRQVRQLF